MEKLFAAMAANARAVEYTVQTAALAQREGRPMTDKELEWAHSLFRDAQALLPMTMAESGERLDAASMADREPAKSTAVT